MIRSINKQQLVRERLARELLVLHLEGRDHLRPVQQYAESYGVGRGTVQSAFQELRTAGPSSSTPAVRGAPFWSAWNSANSLTPAATAN